MYKLPTFEAIQKFDVIHVYQTQDDFGVFHPYTENRVKNNMMHSLMHSLLRNSVIYHQLSQALIISNFFCFHEGSRYM